MDRKIKFSSKLVIFKIESESNRMCCMIDDINTINRRSFNTEYLKKKYGMNWYNYVIETPTIDTSTDGINKNFQSIMTESHNKLLGIKPVMSYDNLEQLALFQD